MHVQSTETQVNGDQGRHKGRFKLAFEIILGMYERQELLALLQQISVAGT